MHYRILLRVELPEPDVEIIDSVRYELADYCISMGVNAGTALEAISLAVTAALQGEESEKTGRIAEIELESLGQDEVPQEVWEN
jgi:hypothetical protein